MTDMLALTPFYSDDRGCWVVGMIPASTEVKVAHGHCTFDTEDEALAFVAKNNGALT